MDNVEFDDQSHTTMQDIQEQQTSPARTKPLLFYKLMVASIIHDNKLKIPGKVVKRIEKELKIVVMLSLPDGRNWNMKLEKDNGKCWFADGWVEFLEHYRIGLGYLLIFRYKGDSTFFVNVFNLGNAEILYSTPCAAVCGSISVKVSQENLGIKGKELEYDGAEKKRVSKCKESRNDGAGKISVSKERDIDNKGNDKVPVSKDVESGNDVGTEKEPDLIPPGFAPKVSQQKPSISCGMPSTSGSTDFQALIAQQFNKNIELGNNGIERKFVTIGEESGNYGTKKMPGFVPKSSQQMPSIICALPTMSELSDLQGESVARNGHPLGRVPEEPISAENATESPGSFMLVKDVSPQFYRSNVMSFKNMKHTRKRKAKNLQIANEVKQDGLGFQVNGYAHLGSMAEESNLELSAEQELNLQMLSKKAKIAQVPINVTRDTASDASRDLVKKELTLGMQLVNMENSAPLSKDIARDAAPEASVISQSGPVADEANRKLTPLQNLILEMQAAGLAKYRRQENHFTIDIDTAPEARTIDHLESLAEVANEKLPALEKLTSEMQLGEKAEYVPTEQLTHDASLLVSENDPCNMGHVTEEVRASLPVKEKLVSAMINSTSHASEWDMKIASLKCRNEVIRANLLNHTMATTSSAKKNADNINCTSPRMVAAAKKKKTLQLTSIPNTSNPHCIVHVGASYLKREGLLHIPIKFAKYLKQPSAYATLQNVEGKQWKVRVLYTCGQYKLSQGWYQFAVDNNLKEGDICIFEHLNFEDTILKVSFIRSAPPPADQIVSACPPHCVYNHKPALDETIQ